MEEKENGYLQLNCKPKLSQQLHKVSQIEKNIESKKMHINFLSKQENIQEKKIEALYNHSIKAANNKINHVSTHIFQKELQGNRHNEYRQKKGLVKEMREKEIKDLRQTRLQVSQMREKQTKELREYSRMNYKTIQSLRNEEIEKNIEKAEKIRMKEREKKNRILFQKQQKKKQLDEKHLQLNQQLEKRHSYLLKYLEKLEKEEEEIYGRIHHKKEIQHKIQTTARGISEIQDEEVVEMARTCRKKMVKKKSSDGEIAMCEKKILQKAIEKDRTFRI